MRIILYRDADPKHPWRWKLMHGRTITAQSGRGYSTQRKAAVALYELLCAIEFGALSTDMWDAGVWMDREEFVLKVIGQNQGELA